jgi:uncharacterized protein YbjT (DUF2867 family)
MLEALITVFGATGRQGGAVARALLARRRWRVRAVTRRPQSVAAQALAAAGAELCQADLDEPLSLAAALRGAAGVFAATNYWEHGDAERELRQAANLAEAAAQQGALRQLVWSTLEDTRQCFAPDGSLFPLQQGRFNVPPMDAKGESNALFLDRDLPVCLLLGSFYWENLLQPGMQPRRAADGVLELALPLGEALLPGIAVADIGACAAALFDGPPCQRRIGIAGDQLSGAQLAAAMVERLGEPVRYVDVPTAAYARLPMPGATELAAMFAYQQLANGPYCAARPVAATRALHPGLLDFPAWLRTQPAFG